MASFPAGSRDAEHSIRAPQPGQDVGLWHSRLGGHTFGLRGYARWAGSAQGARSNILIANRRVSAAAACGFLVAALLTPTGSADASLSAEVSRIVLRDGAGDVERMVPPDTTSYPYGAFPPADVTRARVSHRADALVMKMRFVNLRRVGTQRFWTDIKTPGPHHYKAELTTAPGARQGSKVFELDNVAKRCRGFRRTVDYADDVVTMRIARTCLGNPSWVRVMMMSILVVKDGGPLYIDHPHSRGTMITPTPRLYSD